MLTAFTAGLLLITLMELGDKTFFIAALLATRHARHLVFGGVVAALALMTILSVLMGQVLLLLPDTYQHYVDVLEVFLFIGFGLKLLYDAYQMSPQRSLEECEEAATIVKNASTHSTRSKRPVGIVIESFLLTFVAEWGDRTQFATITLAASNNPVGVTAGAILGHTVCAAIAVLCGCMMAGRLSERVITAMGGILFLLFAGLSWIS